MRVSRVVCVGIFGAVVVVAAAGGGAWAVQNLPVDGQGIVHACYNAKSGAVKLNVNGSCPKAASTPITWNAQGQQGPPGQNGQDGKDGKDGQQGVPGPAGQDTEIAMHVTSTLSTDIATVNGVTLSVGCNFVGLSFVNASMNGPGTVFYAAKTPSIGTIENGHAATISAPVPNGNGAASLRLVSTGGSEVASAHGVAMVQQAPSLSAVQESGIWFDLTVEADNINTQSASCDVSGVVAPVNGTRYLPLPLG